MNDLYAWLIKNKNLMAINLKEILFPKELEIKLFFYRTSMTINNEEDFGWGYSLDRETALIKACSECIERHIFNYYQYDLNTTNGLAIHDTYKDAKANSIAELIERDSFLSHYLTKTPFIHIHEEEIKNNIYKSIKDFALRYGIEVYLSKMHSPEGVHAFIFSTYGESCTIKKYGSLFGLGCDVDQNKAMERALLECAVQLFYYLSTGTENESITLEEFKNKGNLLDLSDHRLLHLNTDYANYTKRLFPLFRKGESANYGRINLTDISVKEINLPYSITDAPIIATHAYSHAVQNLFFQETAPEKINLGRLSNFLGKNISMSDIETFPHPLS